MVQVVLVVRVVLVVPLNYGGASVVCVASNASDASSASGASGDCDACCGCPVGERKWSSSPFRYASASSCTCVPSSAAFFTMYSDANPTCFNHFSKCGPLGYEFNT